MKMFLAIVVLVLFGTSCVAQQALANKPPNALGPVKSIRYEDSSIKFSRDRTRIEHIISNGRTVVWSFTPQGRLLSSEIFERDGRPSGTKSLYTYDSAGRLISIVNYLLGSLSYTETFAYPEPRRVRIRRVYDFDGRPEVEVDELDVKGRVMKATIHDFNGSVETELYDWDTKGNPRKVEIYDTSGKLVFKETYEYQFDSHGNWIMQRQEAWHIDPHSGIAPRTTIRRKIAYY